MIYYNHILLFLERGILMHEQEYYQGWDEWYTKFKPIKNKFSKYDEEMFNTYGEEVEYIKSLNPQYVWTLVDGDMSTLLVAGYAYVNRLAYYVCEVPWESELEYVLVSVEVECKCLSDPEDIDTASPDCLECEGSGIINKEL
jgi:hypothetical protein